MKLDVFIPAGGIGTRLRPLTYFYPKSCLPIKGCPVITNAIESCLPYCKSLFISTYYKKEMVRKCLKNKPYFDKLLFLYDKKLPTFKVELHHLLILTLLSIPHWEFDNLNIF
ncbi:hypothetical protein KKG65_03710 [Patescibacteria group bacterium]|nr:hypothetical protein [Patescibacteria group bacterium]